MLHCTMSSSCNLYHAATLIAAPLSRPQARAGCPHRDTVQLTVTTQPMRRSSPRPCNPRSTTADALTHPTPAITLLQYRTDVLTGKRSHNGPLNLMLAQRIQYPLIATCSSSQPIMATAESPIATRPAHIKSQMLRHLLRLSFPFRSLARSISSYSPLFIVTPRSRYLIVAAPAEPCHVP